MFEVPRARFQENDSIPKIINRYLDSYLRKVVSTNSFETLGVLSKAEKEEIDLDIYREHYINTLEDLIKYLKATFEAYFANSPSQAYEALTKGLSIPMVQNILVGSKRFVVNRKENSYRVRSINRSTSKGIKLSPVNIGDLFHIPYELRRLITTQRYSMPGFPCLYVGNSLNVAYHEVIEYMALAGYKSKIRDSNIAFAMRLRNTYPLRCFDLSPISVPNLLLELHAQDTDGERKWSIINKIYKYGLIWPIIASCYYQIAYKNKRNVSFKSEYVIPQLMLQWFQDVQNEADGIRYLSVNMCHQCDRKDIIGYNYVFPVKEILDRGHCPILKHSFEVTQPLNSSAYKIKNYNDHKSIELMQTKLLNSAVSVW